MLSKKKAKEVVADRHSGKKLGGLMDIRKYKMLTDDM